MRAPVDYLEQQLPSFVLPTLGGRDEQCSDRRAEKSEKSEDQRRPREQNKRPRQAESQDEEAGKLPEVKYSKHG
jgi:hypothetical protein